MLDQSTVDELLLRWEEARQQGARLSPEQICENDPELLPTMTQRIHAIEEMENLLGVTDLRFQGTLLQPTAPQTFLTSDSLPQIPGYQILRLLDQGGMGIVYEALQIKLSRTVAIKMISRARMDPKLVDRFLSEAKSAARLHHPNIVQIFEVGEVDGRPFFSMEHVGGGNLRDHLAGKPCAATDAAEIVEALARAVQVTHEQGIVHRDLKPANVLLALDGTPKIADFGIAKRLDDDSGHTQTGEVLGTPGYVAPEQAEGNLKLIGRHTDVHALGIILYEMLTGTGPFQAANPLASLKMVTTKTPVPPSKLVSGVPRDLEAICLKCLEKSPTWRYPSAEDLADDLRNFLDGKPVSARPVGLARKTWRWIRHHPITLLVSIGVSLLAMIPLVLWMQKHYQQQRLEERAEKLAPQVREILKRNCYECHGQDAKKIEKDLNVLDHDQLLKSDRRIVVPGFPEESRLIQRIADGSMPPEKEETRLPRVTEKELIILKEWIRGGAPDLPAEDKNNPTPPVVQYSELANQARQIFENRCYDCHRYDVAEGGIKILHHRLLVTVRKVIIPGDPDRSELIHLLTTKDEERRMPPVTEPPLSQEEINVLREWIRAGAQPFPKPK